MNKPIGSDPWQRSPWTPGPWGINDSGSPFADFPGPTPGPWGVNDHSPGCILGMTNGLAVAQPPRSEPDGGAAPAKKDQVSFLLTYLPKLKEFEGNIPYMYLDTAGNVTVGVGEMLPNVGAAQKLAFVRRADPSAEPPVVAGPATADEIKTDYENVDKQTSGKLASYYKQFTKLDLPGNVIDTLLTTRVKQFTTQLVVSFPDFDSYPNEAQAALFDMAYNLGTNKLTSQFPTFCKAVKDKDWAKAATECKRGGIPDDRNNWTKAQFEAAAAASKAKPAK